MVPRHGGVSRYGGLPVPRDDERLARAGPRWHGDPQRGERLVADGAELKAGAPRDGEADPWIDRHRLLPPGLFTPHFPLACEKEPDLIDDAMGHRRRDLAGREREMR